MGEMVVHSGLYLPPLHRPMPAP